MPLRDTRQRCRQSPRLKFAAANVVVQPGGKPVIGKFVQSVMNPGEGVLYPNPATRLREHDRVLRRCQPAIPLYTDRDRLRDTSITAQQHHAAQKGTARATICNNLQNPLIATPAEMQAIADIAIEHELGAGRRGFRDALLGNQFVDCIVARHARSHRHPLYVLQEFAMTAGGWRCDRPLPSRHHQAEHQRRVAPPLRPGRGVAGITGPSDGPKDLDELHRRRTHGISWRRSTASCARSQSRRSICSPTSRP